MLKIIQSMMVGVRVILIGFGSSLDSEEIIYI